MEETSLELAKDKGGAGFEICQDAENTSTQKLERQFVYLVHPCGVLLCLIVIDIPAVLPVGCEQRHHEPLKVSTQVALQVLFQVSIELW